MRSADNLCLPFAIYVFVPKNIQTLLDVQFIRSSMPANLLSSHLYYSSPSYSPCSWTGYYVFMSIIINTSFIITSIIAKTLPKAQRTRGLSSSCQTNILKSYHELNTNLDHIFRISTKHQLKITTKHQHLY